MDRGQIMFRGIAKLVGASNAAALALQQNREQEYQAARRAFWATCAESDRLLEVADRALAHVSELGPR